MMMAKPKPVRAHIKKRADRRAQAEVKRVQDMLRNKKKRKGMMGCCVPTFATMGVVCLMWLPKIFLTLGIAFTISGMILLILGTQEHLRYDSGKTSGAVLLGFGIVFVVIASIGLYLKRLMRSIPDPDTGEQRFEIRFNEDKKDIYQVEDDYRRPKSVVSHTVPSATKANSAPTGGARPKTTVQAIGNGSPVANGGPGSGNINMSNARPGSSAGRSPNRSPNNRGSDRPLNASSNRPSSARSASPYLPDSPVMSRPGTSSGRPSSGRPSSGRPSSGRPSSGRPSSGRPSSGRPMTSISRTSSNSPREQDPRQIKSARTPRSAIEDSDDDIRISRDKPFVTRSSASLNSSLGSSGGLKAHVEVHAPPSINVISDTSFSNQGFEDDGDDSLSLHPMATLDAETAEVLARSAPASPMFTPRHMQKEIIVSELSDDD